MGNDTLEYGTPVMTPLGPGVVAQRSQGVTPKRSPAPGEWVSGRWVSGVDASGQPFCEWIVLRDLRVLPAFDQGPDAAEVEARVQATLTSQQQMLDGLLAADLSRQPRQPGPFDATDLQCAIDNTVQVIRDGRGSDAGDPALVWPLLENHLAGLLAVQMALVKTGVAA